MDGHLLNQHRKIDDFESKVSLRSRESVSWRPNPVTDRLMLAAGKLPVARAMLDTVNIGLAIEMGEGLERLANGIRCMDGNLKSFFKEKHYGDVSHVFIGLILTDPASDRFHSVRRARFRRVLNFTSRITRERVNLQNVLEFDVKPDYERTRVLNADAAIEYIAHGVVDSIDQLAKLAKRLPNFDIAAFRRDVHLCLLP